MAISPSGTFDYVAVVPDDRRDDERPWKVQLCAPRERTGKRPIEDPLVGRTPALEICDAGMTPDVRVSDFAGTVRPRVLRSRITLKAVRPAAIASYISR